MAAIGNFCAGALAGLVISVAVGAPLLHYGGPDGGAALRADLGTAFLGKEYGDRETTPAHGFGYDNGVAVTWREEPLPQVSALRLQPTGRSNLFDEMARNVPMGGVLDIMTGPIDSEMHSIKTRPGETVEQALERELSAVRPHIMRYMQQQQASGQPSLQQMFLGRVANQACGGSAGTTQSARDKALKSAECAALQGAVAGQFPFGLNSGNRSVSPPLLSTQSRSETLATCRGNAPSDLSPAERARRNDLCRRLMPLK